MIDRFVRGVDRLSETVGHAFAWCIIILTLGTTYEVVVRYAFNNPTSWAFDFSYTMYGALFFMAGAYALSRNSHVRGDFVYRMWRPRVQASVELTLYVVFFFPGVLALVYSGWLYGYDAFKIREVSVNSPVGIPVWQLKLLIPFGAGMLAIQGLAECLRCIVCIRDNQWPLKGHDVEELEDVLMAQHASQADAQEKSR